MYIFFDTATFDKIERDVKVKRHIFNLSLTSTSVISSEWLITTQCVTLNKKGDKWSAAEPDWRHDGSSYWLLHPQWGRDHLLSDQTLLLSQVETIWCFFKEFLGFLGRIWWLQPTTSLRTTWWGNLKHAIHYLFTICTDAHIHNKVLLLSIGFLII